MGFIATFGSFEKPPKAVKRVVGGKQLKSKDAEGNEIDMIDPDASEDGVMNCNATGEQVKRHVHHSCKVVINGRESTLADLRSGDKIDVDGNPAITINVNQIEAPGARPAATEHKGFFGTTKK